jgi:hypothetical protein
MKLSINKIIVFSCLIFLFSQDNVFARAQPMKPIKTMKKTIGVTHRKQKSSKTKKPSRRQSYIPKILDFSTHTSDNLIVQTKENVSKTMVSKPLKEFLYKISFNINDQENKVYEEESLEELKNQPMINPSEIIEIIEESSLINEEIFHETKETMDTNQPETMVNPLFNNPKEKKGMEEKFHSASRKKSKKEDQAINQQSQEIITESLENFNKDKNIEESKAIIATETNNLFSIEDDFIEISILENQKVEFPSPHSNHTYEKKTDFNGHRNHQNRFNNSHEGENSSNPHNPNNSVDTITKKQSNDDEEKQNNNNEQNNNVGILEENQLQELAKKQIIKDKVDLIMILKNLAQNMNLVLEEGELEMSYKIKQKKNQFVHELKNFGFKFAIPLVLKNDTFNLSIKLGANNENSRLKIFSQLDYCSMNKNLPNFYFSLPIFQ